MALEQLLAKEPVVSAECNEPAGSTTVKIIRHVRELDFTPEHLQIFWKKSRKHKTLFTQEVNQDFNKFCNLLLDIGANGVMPTGLFWVVDDFVGVFYLTRIVTGVDAVAHYAFFDGRQKGREQLVKSMIKYVFEEYGFHRLSAEIPYYASNIFPFIEAIGFKHEMRKRSAVHYDNQWFDVNCFGLLKDEVLT